MISVAVLIHVWDCGWHPPKKGRSLIYTADLQKSVSFLEIVNSSGSQVITTSEHRNVNATQNWGWMLAIPMFTSKTRKGEGSQAPSATTNAPSIAKKKGRVARLSLSLLLCAQES